MRNWELNAIDVEPHHPQVLDSESEGRLVLLELPAGEQLSEHQVHERAWLVVVRGRIEVTQAEGQSIQGGDGFLAEFDPRERRTVEAREDTRLLLVLSPWPGDGHPSTRSM